ncbi:MAG: indolepyruvate ferredoxin oxidoreductase subunit alpha [Deltaproteobacteria bacterium RBG_13_52_11b]|nr:MAG: indolepyruvate ferredoxin oxidoreductase subunit alpha [Deltaproteobacteria bacterium RBG_13_52_11b]
MKKVMTGNEAIARGAFEAGVKVAAAYPGTPSTEIMETLGKEYKEIYAEWSPNEKVALEVAIGASLAGARAMSSMKHVGVNVAADPLMTLSYVGVNGGLVLVSCDDPELYSSQNEQDNRHYARFAKIPMFEPSDSQEAKDFTKLGFEVSEKFDTPVMLRGVTRISHSKGIVELKDPVLPPVALEVRKQTAKYTMLPAYARVKHGVVEERLLKLKEFAETFPGNRMELNDRDIGIITAGISYQYAKEVFPKVSYLKLGMVWPLPRNLIAEFFKKVKKVIVIEELDPFLEENIKVMGFKPKGGKNLFSLLGEYNPLIVEKGMLGKKFKPPEPVFKDPLPPRPPNLCPGCPHRGIFYMLKKLKLVATGDIGCYTLAAYPPLASLDTCICMGASIGQAHGMAKAMGDAGRGKFVGVIGDSTFLHGGIAPLMNIAYNKSYTTIILLDNRTTGMTGSQEHPGTGYTIRGEKTHKIDFVELGKVLGIENIREVNPWNLEEAEKTIREEIEKDSPSLIITKGPCILLKREFKKYNKPLVIDSTKCIGCKSCVNLGCPAISFQKVEGEMAVTKDGKKRKGISYIEPTLCPGCHLCYQVCKFEAIQSQEERPVLGFDTM